jgi:hypothetical protein
VAGPWFVVYPSGADWQYMGNVWISNGQTDCMGKFYVKATLTTDREEQHARVTLK